VNLILFTPDELDKPLSMEDKRAQHLANVLDRLTGEEFDAGIVNGPRGKARVTNVTPTGLLLSFSPTVGPESPHPVTLIVGAARPVSARRMLREATSMGVAAVWVCGTDRGEPSYLSSRLWRERTYEKALREGAEQAFVTIIPEVRLFPSVAETIAAARGTANRLALDNYEATETLADWQPLRGDCVLAVGSERGWSREERRNLEGGGFVLQSLGSRVLRTDTACVAGLALVLAAMGRLSQ
jgi:RsmE family RNA methyltransferase